MGIKLFAGRIIEICLERLIILNYKMVPFVPNGRILPLDLKRAGIDPENIFDVGANIGQTANYFNKHFPKTNIYCFEPVQEVYEQLVINTPNSRIKCFNQALGNEITQVTIYKADFYNGIASINGAGNKSFTTEEIIEIIVGKDFCNELQIPVVDLLKIDTEGYELNVLKGFGSMLKTQVKFIYAEVCFDHNDPCHTHITTLLDYLSPFGYIISGFYNPYRVGRDKLKLNHCDVLLTNTNLIGV